MSRVLLLESVSGVAGDMFAAAFADAGLVPAEALHAVPAALGLEGVEVELSTVDRSGVSATALRVVGAPEEVREAGGTAGHSHRHWRELDERLASAALEPAARAFARRVYRLLAEAEAEAHGVDPERVGLHEVGEDDSLVDVAMAGVCIARANASRVLASPIRLGHGTLSIAHGRYPVPPPASARLCQGMPVAPTPPELGPTRFPDLELSTPTGLAILRALDPEFVAGWPAGVPRAHGYGAGSRELDGYPNVFRVALFDQAAPGAGTSEPFEQDRVVEIACNLDDQTPERTGWLLDRALELGALDAWAVPIVGKKGRPAVCVTLLVPPGELDRWNDWLLRSSSTFGVRFRSWERRKLVRTTEVRDTPRGAVRIQVGSTTGGERVKEKPELEDLRTIWREDPGFRLD